MDSVLFEEELARVLPQDVPHRSECVEKTAKHLAMIVEVNQQFNLTRITDPQEAVAKHVLDSILPWRLFEQAGHVLDAGTGAGFPGIPLALVLPETEFTLLESTQKKARFVQSVVDALELKNVEVLPVRAEDWLKSNHVEILTARAVAPVERAIPMFAPALRKQGRIVLYKGPDVDAEIAAGALEARKRQVRVRVVYRYELPGGYGMRSIVEISRK